MRTVQVIGVPNAGTDIGDAEAVVVALKSRTNPVEEAISQSVESLLWLKENGARQYFFKYCSTFDSTDQGNIGPVSDALLDALGDDFSIVCPAFPTNGRTIYKGHLFVGDVLLSNSSMKNHPLTPMHDSNLAALMDRQTSSEVGVIPYEVVSQGADAIEASYKVLRESGKRYAIVDALNDADLFSIGKASRGLSLITGGSGVAMGLPDNFRQDGLLGDKSIPVLPAIIGPRAVLSGSCSEATRRQVSYIQNDWPTYKINPYALAEGEDEASQALAWSREQNAETPVLISSSADPEEVQVVQKKLGRERVGSLVEDAFGSIARGLVEGGLKQLIVAGGETSGAVVQALEVPALRIGPEIDPGVPWTETLGGTNIALALKSGNFGSEDFFQKAFSMLPR